MYSTPLSANQSPLRASRSTTMDSPQSPYQARVKNIAKKLTDIQYTVESNNNQNKCDEVEKEIRQMDEKITNNYIITEERLKACTQDVLKLEDTMATEIIPRELLEERNFKEMDLVENNLALELKNAKQESKEAERRMLQTVEQKVRSVRTNYAEEQGRLEDLKNEQTETISGRVNAFQQSLKEEQATREQGHNNIIKTVGGKLTQFKDTLNAERKNRHETETALFRKIEDICNNLQSQVKNEREKRERTEGQMLQLLEEACNKFEDHVRYSRR